jgi:hypothetical protein
MRFILPYEIFVTKHRKPNVVAHPKHHYTREKSPSHRRPKSGIRTRKNVDSNSAHNEMFLESNGNVHIEPCIVMEPGDEEVSNLMREMFFDELTSEEESPTSEFSDSSIVFTSCQVSKRKRLHHQTQSCAKRRRPENGRQIVSLLKYILAASLQLYCRNNLS